MTIEVGVAVRLKAHPARRMVVVSIEDDWAVCRWFDKAAVQEVAFSVDDIEPIPAAEL